MKLFSPEKANALIPVLTPMLEELWAKRRELAIKLLEQDPALAPSGIRSRTAWRGEALHGAQSGDRPHDQPDRIVRLRREGSKSGIARLPRAPRRASGFSVLENR